MIPVVVKVSRRDFLRVAPAAGACLVLGVCLSPDESESAQQAGSGGAFSPNAFVSLDAEGRVTIWASNSEMGQGPRTALPMIVADEMEADWSRVHVAQAWTEKKFGRLDTGGSSTVRTKYEPMRRAGAAARAMLVAAAAKTWNVEASSCRAENGAVVHPASGRRLDYGRLAAAAAALPVPENPPLKEPSQFRIIGTNAPRTDTPAKVDGSAVYGIDFRLPGMLYAAVARCPVFGGEAASFDPAAAKKVPGVRDVVKVSSGIAVVADTTWAAFKGRDALKVAWNEGPHAGETTEGLRRQMRELSQAAGKPVRDEGNARAALASAAKKVEAVYEVPCQAHAAMEPGNATARVMKDRCEVWAPAQTPSWALDELQRVTGLPKEAIRIEITLLGGGFGRRINPDVIVEAAEISKALGAPVKTVWTREDDLRHDFYRPPSLHRLEGGLDAAGSPVAWVHRIVSPAIEAFYDPDTKKPEDSEIGGAVDMPYGIPGVRVEYALAKSGVPRGWWRSVESSANAFAVECFMDELAALSGRDPLQLRLDLLADGRSVEQPAGHGRIDLARLKRVLRLAAEKAGWGTPLQPGRARGIAAHFSFRSYCAQVAEVSVVSGAVRVHRVVCAIDCGRAINPRIVAQQVEGGVVFGLTAALKSEITIDKGRVVQGNFDDYEMLRIDEAPVVETHIVPSAEAPTGVGEPCVPVVAPAVANALYAATGQRVRRLPVRPADLARS